MQSVTAAEWGESVGDQGLEALLETLHCLRVAITIFDAERGCSSPTPISIISSAPCRRVKTLIGKIYEELIRAGTAGDIAPPP